MGTKKKVTDTPAKAATGKATPKKRVQPKAIDSSRQADEAQQQKEREALALARKALLVLRAEDPLTLDDIPVKLYTPEEIQQLMAVHCSALAEHSDTVQIFITTQQEGKTSSYYYGIGNHYARAAQIQEWVAMSMGDAGPAGGDIVDFGGDTD